MRNFITLTKLFLILILITSCKRTLNQDEFIKNSEDKKNDLTTNSKKKMEVRFSCEEDGISELLNKGWTIVEEYTEEKICTWKSVPANKKCDMEKDKGCKITIPDKIGKEKIYLLEK